MNRSHQTCLRDWAGTSDHGGKSVVVLARARFQKNQVRWLCFRKCAPVRTEQYLNHGASSRSQQTAVGGKRIHGNATCWLVVCPCVHEVLGIAIVALSESCSSNSANSTTEYGSQSSTTLVLTGTPEFCCVQPHVFIFIHNACPSFVWP